MDIVALGLNANSFMKRCSKTWYKNLEMEQSQNTLIAGNEIVAVFLDIAGSMVIYRIFLEMLYCLFLLYLIQFF